MPEWNDAETAKVMALWIERGRKPEWKPISMDLAAANKDGSLNADLKEKGMQRTNNAVMNKVKELSGQSAPRRCASLKYLLVCWVRTGLFLGVSTPRNNIVTRRPQGEGHAAHEQRVYK